jgi:hypothetical protein
VGATGVSDDLHGDAATPAEERLLTHLDDLRRHPPEPVAELASIIVRSARWQLVTRPYLLAVGALAVSVAEAARVGMGRRR